MNLLSAENASFEGGTTGDWSGAWGTCTLSNSTSWAAVGTHSLKITPTEGKTLWTALNVTALTSPSGTDTYSCQFKGIAGKNYYLCSSDDVTGLSFESFVVADGTTQTLMMIASFDATSTDRQIGFMSLETHAAAQVVYVDNVTLAPPPPPPIAFKPFETKPAPPTVELWNADMTQRYPNIDKEIQSLKFSSILYGGFATCTFELFRKPWVHYPDLALGNIVIVRSRHQIPWYGRINAPATDTTDLKLSIQADGPIERLKTRLVLASLGAATKGSAWILTNIIGDLGYDAGNIYTDDYAYESGIDFTAGVPCSEAVTDINKGNNFRYGFFPPPTSNVMAAESFDFWPISTTPEYYLDMKDCDTKIQYTKDGIENVLYVKWNDGTDHYFWWPHDGGGVAIPDAASVALYDRRDGKLDISGTVTLAEAEHLAQVALDWRKRIRPAADITARKITDVNGATVPNAEVQAGRVLHIRGLNPGEFTLLTAQSLNELCTWPIIMSAPDIDACTVTLSPGGLGNTLEKLLARVEMVKRT